MSSLLLLEIPSHSIFLMLLGNVHEVFDKLELELERFTRHCNWQSVKYLREEGGGEGGGGIC